MIKKTINKIKCIEKNILKIMFSGFKISFIIGLLSAIILLTYIINPLSPILYNSGLILFKTSLTFAVAFFVCALVVDNVKKQMI